MAYSIAHSQMSFSQICFDYARINRLFIQTHLAFQMFQALLF